MADCIFCKIKDKQIPSSAVYEDEEVYAFNDIHPAAPVHVLIIPKKHIAGMNDINESNADILKAIHLAAVKIAQKVGIADKGYRLINNCGQEAGQTVMHLHYHLLGGKPLGDKIV